MLPGIWLPMAGFVRGRAIEIVAEVDETPSGSSHTFSGVSFGPVFSGRVLVACIGLVHTLGNDGVLDQASCTIGGVAAAGGDNGRISPAGNAIGIGIWSAAVPSGGSGDVFVGWTGTAADAARLVLISIPLVSAVPHDQNGTFSGTNSVSTTVDIPPGGSLVVGGVHFGSSDITLGGVTERNEAPLGGERMAIGFDSGMAEEINRQVTCSGSSINRAIRATSLALA